LIETRGAVSPGVVLCHAVGRTRTRRGREGGEVDGREESLRLRSRSGDRACVRNSSGGRRLVGKRGWESWQSRQIIRARLSAGVGEGRDAEGITHREATGADASLLGLFVGDGDTCTTAIGSGIEKTAI
jgi:hypothetical protein